MAAKTGRVSAAESAALAAELESTTDAEIRFDPTSRALYATDASNYRQVPIGVVVPRTTDDVVATMAACRKFDAPVLARGGGTSLSGQTCNVAVVIDFSKYLNRVLEIDPERQIARVQPGTVLDDLRDATERHKLTFGPDPATHNRCTLGGMIGNNSCGVHSVMAGKTDANVISLDVLTYRGDQFTARSLAEGDLEMAAGRNSSEGRTLKQLRALRDRYANEIRAGFSDIPRRVSGFDLPYLLPEREFNVPAALVGTEGTCVSVLEAELRLVHSPPCRSLLVLAFEDIFVAAENVCEILEFGPIGLEGMDHRLIADLNDRDMYQSEVRLLPLPAKGDGGWLLVEFGGSSVKEAEDKARKLMRHFDGASAKPGIRLCETAREARRLWEVRESGLGAGALVPGQFMRWPGWDDSAVAPDVMASYLRDLQKLMTRYDYDGAFYGHFGDGCLHVRYNFDLQTKAGIDKYANFLSDAADLVVSYGGSLSGEHGDGQSHGELLSKMYSPELMQAFREFKEIWDPDWKMNPGKVIDPLPIRTDIRLDGFEARTTKTVFQYPDDAGKFSMAALRCVGVGKCRRHDGGVMCPSYMATRDEMHSTRGRARLLFEMLQGDVIADGWRNKGVRESLDLCLACKGCKTDCPVGVDMATYKAEFLSHYYSRRIRPRAAYTMGLIWWWARLASRTPRVVNLAGRLPVISAVIKAAAGIAQDRRLPIFARQTFKCGFAQREKQSRPPKTPDRGRVILWADTFNNHFHPEVCNAALEVLESAGFEVSVPRAPVCCGRPLYDFGMLDLARHLLRRILRVLSDDLEAGVPVVVLEPSCASVFKDELLNLFPDDKMARRLSEQTFLLGDFLERHAPDHAWRQLPGAVLIQTHCHQASLFGSASDRSLVQKLGMSVEVVNKGCCGMAGAFGFESEHVDVSVAVANQGVLPAIAASEHETVVVTDGFSCREQVSQLSDRSPVHMAELLARALP